MEADRNCLSYWFPRLAQAGIPIPKTEIVTMSRAISGDINEQDIGCTKKLIEDLTAAALRISTTGPWFLRTGHGSGKHEWDRCCNLTDLARLPHHVSALVDWSEMVDFLGLPTSVWCVRERLPVVPIATLTQYGNMPLVQEFRFFIRNGRVICTHPYWPEPAIRIGLADEQKCNSMNYYAKQFGAMSVHKASFDLARMVAAAFPEAHGWSVDLLNTSNGWYVTDMAMAERSYHTPHCILWETK